MLVTARPTASIRPLENEVLAKVITPEIAINRKLRMVGSDGRPDAVLDVPVIAS
jgi:hypothetical protein